MSIKPYLVILLLLFIGCKTASVPLASITSLEDGLYYYDYRKGDPELFIRIDQGKGYPEYFSVGSDMVYLRDAFKDTLIKQSDSLYAGKNFLVRLSSGILYFDSYFNPKYQYPIKLSKANEEIEKEWIRLHSRLKRQ